MKVRAQIPVLSYATILITILHHLFALPLHTVPSLKEQYHIKNWGIENGLSQGTIASIIQTPDGYIWLATQESLTRFDGVRFTNFTSKNTPELKSSWIESLTLSQDKTLIIGTWRGGIYEYRDNRFISLVGAERPELFHSIIYDLIVDDSGVIWAGTSDGLFSLKGGELKHFGAAQGLLATTIRSLLIDRSGALWIGTEDEGLWSYQHKVFTAFTLDSDPTTGNRSIWALTSDGQQGIWIGNGHILTHYDGERFQHHPVPVRHTPNQITCLTHDSENRLWFGILNEGVWCFQDGQFSRTSTEEGLSSELSLSVMVDTEANVWVGTNGNGVCQLIQNRIKVISTDEGLSAKSVWTVMETKDDSLWVGTHGGGLCRIVNGTVVPYSTRQGLASLYITALFESPSDGTLWIGSENNGIMHLKGERFEHHRLGPTVAENTVYAINELRDGTKLVGTAGGIVYWRGNQVSYRLTTREGLSHNSVRDFIPTQNPNEFWVSTDIGLNLIRDNKIVSSWQNRDGLKEDAINGLFLDNDQNLWIGTYGGGIVHFKANRFTSIGTESGLFNDVIYGFLEDASGRLWMSSNRGIFSLKKKELLEFIAGQGERIQSYPLSQGDGLKALECNGGRQPSLWLTRSGQACFSTIDGVAILDTTRFNTEEPSPALLFERVSLNGTPLPPQTAYTIPAGKRNIDIEFTAPSFSAPEKIRFQYRLFPFEEEWSETNGPRMAHYTNIPPGSYRFELLCSNRYGIMSKRDQHLKIAFQPFFYETLTFRILSALALLTLLALYINRRIHHLKKSKRELERAVFNRTKELKAAYEQMERLSVTDTLTELFNRRYFYNTIDREISSAIRQHLKSKQNPISFPMAFLMIDIDHFKQINDRYTHRVGDRFLQLISQRFQSTLRSSDLLVRWGGEEFLILSKENDFNGARLLCQRLLKAINSEPFLIDGREVMGTVSIGFVPFPIVLQSPHTLSWEEVVNLADIALYRAKALGRNCAVGIRMYEERLTPERLSTISEEFNRALDEAIIELVCDR